MQFQSIEWTELFRRFFALLFAATVLAGGFCLVMVFMPEMSQIFYPQPDYERIFLHTITEDFHATTGVPIIVAIETVKPSGFPRQDAADAASQEAARKKWEEGLQGIREKSTATGTKLVYTVWFPRERLAVFNFFGTPPGVAAMELYPRNDLELSSTRTNIAWSFGMLPRGSVAGTMLFGASLDLRDAFLPKLHWYSQRYPAEALAAYRDFRKLFALWSRGTVSVPDATILALLRRTVGAGYERFLWRVRFIFLPSAFGIAILCWVGLRWIFRNFNQKYKCVGFSVSFFRFLLVERITILEDEISAEIRRRRQGLVEEESQWRRQSMRREFDAHLAELSTHYPIESETGRLIAETRQRGNTRQMSELVTTLHQDLLRSHFSGPRGSPGAVQLKVEKPAPRPRPVRKPRVKETVSAASSGVKYVNVRNLVRDQLSLDGVLPREIDRDMAKAIVAVLVSLGSSGDRLVSHHRRRGTLIGRVRHYYQTVLQKPFDSGDFYRCLRWLVRNGVVVIFDEHVQDENYGLNLFKTVPRSEAGEALMSRILMIPKQIREAIV